MGFSLGKGKDCDLDSVGLLCEPKSASAQEGHGHSFPPFLQLFENCSGTSPDNLEPISPHLHSRVSLNLATSLCRIPSHTYIQVEVPITFAAEHFDLDCSP